MYKVIISFDDLHDFHESAGVRSYHRYKPGDVYPRKGLKPSSERIRALLSGKNPLGVPVIRFEVKQPEKGDPETAESRKPAVEAKPKQETKTAPKKKTASGKSTGAKKTAGTAKKSAGTAKKASGTGRTVRPVSRLNR